MRKSSKLTTALAALVLPLCLAAGVAEAQVNPGPGPGMGPGRGRMHRGPGRGARGAGGPMMGPRMGGGPGPGVIARLADELKLTDRQKQQVRNVIDETHKQMIQYRADLQSTEIDLRRELDRDSPDVAKVNGYIDKIGGLETQMRKTHINAWIKVKALLTPQQRAKLQTLHRQRGGPFFDDDGPPGMHGCPGCPGGPPPPQQPPQPPR